MPLKCACGSNGKLTSCVPDAEFWLASAGYTVSYFMEVSKGNEADELAAYLSAARDLAPDVAVHRAEAGRRTLRLASTASIDEDYRGLSECIVVKDLGADDTNHSWCRHSRVPAQRQQRRQEPQSG